MFFVEAGAENPVAAGCVSAAISMLYLESADAAILWVLSPVMLFVLGCGIYSVVRASWTDVFLLTLIEMGLFAAAVGAGGIMELMERLCECVEDVLTI